MGQGKRGCVAASVGYNDTSVQAQRQAGIPCAAARLPSLEAEDEDDEDYEDEEDEEEEELPGPSYPEPPERS